MRRFVSMWLRLFLFFFSSRRRHTRFDCDWSSDVCSSDLEGGLALGGANRRIGTAVQRLTAAGIRVSLFIDPDVATIDRAAALGVPAIELHTGRYARSWRKSDAALRVLERAAAHARARGLAVHAGHGLTYDNVQPVAAIRDIEELNIGHSIVSNAIFVGMEAAVRRMRQLVDEARKP